MTKDKIVKITGSLGASIAACRSSIQSAIGELLKAYELALDARCDKWDFAVEVQVLRRWDLTESDFRWLVSKGIAEHACEVTREKDNHRRFQFGHPLKFVNQTCFVLADRIAREFLASEPEVLPIALRADETNADHRHPCWNSARHELRVDEFLVKRFRWPAKNQERILAAFEEEGWPDVGIDDPIPPHSERDPKQRLRDTIKCLNRNQHNSFIRFRADGTGERVLWEFTDAAATVLRTSSSLKRRGSLSS